jgi:hypothetical protein
MYPFPSSSLKTKKNCIGDKKKKKEEKFFSKCL